MKQPGPAIKFAAAFAAGGLLFSSAATASVRAGDFVGSPVMTAASFQAASCAAGAASTAAAGAASVAQAVQTQPGCVLPAGNAAPVATAGTAPPPVYAPAAVGTGGGIGILPLLLGLAAVAGGLALLMGGNGEDDIDLPISRA